ncbi:divergent PAP2 family protein [Candidatus Peregrinibacteria bacterium]|nr:divergent PAP2 family protein [Candidatus Peregrinibacteria bacterium]
MRQSLHQLIGTYPIIIPFAAILVAEATKVVIGLFCRRAKIRFLAPGGMPSGHSSFVSALVVTVAYKEGAGSTLFMISAVIALIVMYDAINLRYEAGKHAKTINKLVPEAKLEESLGHNHLEVVVGAVFGAVVAFLLLSV